MASTTRLKGLGKIAIVLISGHKFNFVAYSDNDETKRVKEMKVLGLGVAGTSMIASVFVQISL